MAEDQISLTVDGQTHRLLWASQGFSKHLGYRLSQVLHCQMLDLVHADDSFRMKSLLSKHGEGGGLVLDYQQELPVIRIRTATASWARCDVVSVQSATSNGTVALSVHLRARPVDPARSLTSSDRRYMALIKESAQAVVVHDGITVLFCSNAAAQMVGIGVTEELVGLPISAFVSTKDRVALDQVRLEFDKDPNASQRLELSIVRLDGTEVAAHASLTLIDWNGLPAVQCLLDPSREEALSLRSAALQATVDNVVSDAIICTDASFRIESWNLGATALYGWTAADVIGRRVGDVVGQIESDQWRESSVADLFELGEWHGPATHRHRKGWTIRVESHVSLLRDHRNVVVGVVAVNRAASPVAPKGDRDPLTGIWDRSGFLLAIDATPSDAPSMIAVIDLDRFTSLNARLGSSLGDQILVELGRRLEGGVRPTDIVARLSGDRFAVLGPVTQISDVRAFGAHLEQIVNEPVWIDGAAVAVSASIGLDWSDSQVMSRRVLENAERALIDAALAGGRRVSVFEHRHVDDPWADNGLFQTELRDAMASGAFYVAYQPIVDLASQRIVKLEALARWDHPERGSLSPEIFIAAAERSGAIGELGQRVLRDAVQACMSHPSMVGLTMSVNLSPVQLRDPGLVSMVARVLQEAHMAPERLWFEVTESMLVADDSIEALLQLHRLGVKLVIDDFGTGFANLQNVRRLPLDALKIDRSFVSGLGVDGSDTAIVRSVINLARELGLEVVAEGVETESQRSQLIGLNCRFGQGWLFGRAVRPDDLPLLHPAIEQANDYDWAVDEPARLSALESCRIFDTDPEPSYDAIVELAADLVGTPMAVVSLVGRDRLWFKARTGFDATELERSGSLCDRAIVDVEYDEPYVLTDTNELIGFAESPLGQSGLGIRAYAAAVIRSREGLPLGTLSVMDTVPRPFDDQSLRRLLHLAGQLSTLIDLRRQAIELAELAQSGQRHGQRLAFDTAMVARVLDPVLILDARSNISHINPAGVTAMGASVDGWIGRNLLEIVHPDDMNTAVSLLTVGGDRGRDDDGCVVIRFGRDDGTWCALEVRTNLLSGLGQPYIVVTGRIPARQDASDRRSERQREFLGITLDHVTDAVVGCDAAGTITMFNLAAKELHGISSTAGAPHEWPTSYGLYTADGSRLLNANEVPLFRALYGERVVHQEILVVAGGRPPRRMRCNAQQLRDTAGAVVGAVLVSHDVTTQRQVETMLRHQAQSDQLTEVANRHRLIPHLDLMLQDPDHVVVLAVLDVNGLKAINDRLGHMMGDQALTRLAQRLRVASRPDDLVGRLGGDEFAVVRIMTEASAADLADFAAMLTELAKISVTSGDNTIDVSASVGVVCSAPGDTASSLLNRADNAMYATKPTSHRPASSAS